jgi:hypothetical protein
VNNGPIT